MMKGLLLIVLISCLIFSPSTVILAQTTESLSPTPTISLEPTVSPEVEQSPTPSTTPTGTNTPTPTETSFAHIGSSAPTATPTIQPTITSPIESTNINDGQIDNTVKIELVSGDNVAEIIKTGDATASANIVNELNTTQIGSWNWIEIINQFSALDNDIDLSEIGGNINNPDLIEALQQNEFTKDGVVNRQLADLISSVNNSNFTSIHNIVDIKVETGGNESTSETGMATSGDVQVDLNLVNIANTNVIGNNTFFSVINLFDNQSGDLILPYELDFIPVQGVEDVYVSTTPEVQNGNSSQIENNISVISNTGNNNGSVVKTGDDTVKLNVIDYANINITDSNFLLLHINNYGNWTGTIDGWWGNQQANNNGLVLWYKLPVSQPEITPQTEVKNNNQAEIVNDINLEANTGENQAVLVETGSSNIKVDIFNLVNTNIIGNNWYYGMVNIFDDFSGNIIFSRPDLHINAQVNKSDIRVNEEFDYFLSYGNNGKTFANDSVISIELPSYLEFISASDGGKYESNKVNWNLGKVAPSQHGSVSFRVKLTDSLQSDRFIVFPRIFTSRYDSNQTNNSTSILVYLKQLTENETTPSSTPSQIKPAITEEVQIYPVVTRDITLQPLLLLDNTDESPAKSGKVQGIFSGSQCVSTIPHSTEEKLSFTLTSFNLPLMLLSGVFFMGYKSIFKTRKLFISKKGGDAQ